MIVGGSEGVNNGNKMGDGGEGLLDVKGEIRAKEGKTAEVLRDGKEKTEKRKVKGGEGVAFDKGRKEKSSKEERWQGVEKDKGDGIEREDGREDKEGKEGKGHIQRRIKRWRLRRESEREGEREREMRHIRIKEKQK